MMDTRTTTSDLLRRIAVRAGHGMRRQRASLLLAAIVIGAAIGYVVILEPSNAASALSQPGPSSTTAVAGASDCANTVMAAIENSVSASTHQAYQCLAPAVQQGMSETTFAQKLASLSVPNVMRITRLGTYQGTTGNTLVYFAVDANTQSVGYVVYVGQDGKVLQIQ
jgi:hypothetical protein